ncbi:retrovirus-related pol polyprotein from transposon 17.6 [Tanacetum coccineum]
MVSGQGQDSIHPDLRIIISEDHAISLFIGGLPVEIAMAVRMFKPRKLADAYCLTNLQEATINAVKKKGRMLYNGSTSGNARFNAQGNNIHKPLLPNPHTTTELAPKNNRKQLTQKEYQEKRANNQCFYCDQRYTPGHKCSGQMYALEVLAGTECEEECLGEEELGEVPQISLNAMHGIPTYRTMRIKGVVGKHVIHILVDCGSTHNFVDIAVAKKLGCKIKSTCPLPVTVGDGYNIATNSECKQFHWQLQGVDFWSDVMLLPLGGCEMVLGIQWLSTLGDIKCNFKDLRMEFVYKGKKMVLRGTPKSNMEWMTNNKQAKILKKTNHPEYSSMQLCVFSGPEISLMRLEGIPTEVKPEFQTVIQEFEEVFSLPTVLPPNRSCDHKIPLLEGSQPVNVRPYRHPPTQKDAIEGMVQELLDTGVIRPSNSPFASPIVMVKKKDNTWRMCVDYRLLNKQTIKDKFPIPIIEELIDELHGSQVFTKLDLRSGYHQIRMCVDDVAKTAFKTHHGHYEFLVMPFGLTNAPSTFQALMNEVFQLFLRKFVLVFFDDILIQTKQVEYWGHVISADEGSQLNQRLRLWRSGPYASISRPLTLLLKKNSFQWNEESQVAFESLKKAMISAPVLALPDFDKEFTVETDASGIGIGAVLIQGGHPIAYLNTWEEDNELKAKVDKLKKGESVRNAYVWENHHGPMGGHVGIKATMHKLCSLFYWRKMRREIKQFVRNCDVCQRSKPGLSAYPGLLQPLPIPNTVWSSISMDFVEGLPKSQGKNVIMVVVDRLSKYGHFIPLAHPFTAVQVAQAFLDNIYKLHGLPESIVSDRDKVFISGIQWIENTHCKEEASSTDLSLKDPQERMKTQADKHRSEREFAVGDWVYLKLQPHRQVSMRMGKFSKLSPKYYGPFQVQERVGAVAYKLILPAQSQIHNVFHVSQLKRCKGQNLQVGILPQCDNSGLIQAQPVAILERKLGKVGNAAGVFVLVQWANSGPEDATWESIEDIQRRFPEFNVLV